MTDVNLFGPSKPPSEKDLRNLVAYSKSRKIPPIISRGIYLDISRPGKKLGVRIGLNWTLNPIRNWLSRLAFWRDYVYALQPGWKHKILIPYDKKKSYRIRFKPPPYYVIFQPNSPPRALYE